MCLSLIYGCSSKEYRISKRICTSQAEAKYPPNIKQRIVQRTKQITIPTANCSRGFSIYSEVTCSQSTMTETIPYTEVINDDLNEDIRYQWIKGCVSRRCYDLYSNSDCDTD